MKVRCNQFNHQTFRVQLNVIKDFQPRHREFFAVGVVFRVVWIEPAGPNPAGGIGSAFTKSIYDGEYDHSQIRIFVVISQQDKHAICVYVKVYSRLLILYKLNIK